jgi:methionyl-tRNA formyltransferase
VIFERSHQIDMIRYRFRKLGPWVFAGQMLFILWDRFTIQPRSQRRIDQLLEGHDISPPDGRIPTHDVESVNDPEVIELVRGQDAKAIIVSGTRIIGRRMLAAGRQFINIHCGITPRYRGVHGAFWAVVEGRPDLAGTTVHLIDPGVDTGAIIGQAAIEVEATDTYRTLPAKQYLVGLRLMEDAVAAALSGSLSTYRRDDLESRQWYSPTPRDYWQYRRNLKKLATQR